MPVLGGLLRKPKKEEKRSEQKSGSSGKTYLKAVPLRDLADLENIKNEVKSGNIVILRITPLASKSIEDVKRAVNELCEFAESISGDIARLGEERVVVCPQNVRIWREKTPVTSEPIPTAA
ncbi:cell division protein SepF [Candidatus Bathyarchaeota archaeon]|nr:cell division protein SepF [Candidatus Bathyarchaeota archaeon]